VYNAVILCDSDRHKAVYHDDLRSELEQQMNVVPGTLDRAELMRRADELRQVRYAWVTWQAPQLTADDLDLLPQLELVLSATGTVKRFARPFLERGIRVCSAKAINAIPVAEFCLGHVLLAGKGVFHNLREYVPDGPQPQKGQGNYRLRLGLIGCGAIARQLIRLCQPFDIYILVYDPFVSQSALHELGCQSASLEECFASCQVVSNHLPKLPSTTGMLGREHFQAMLPRATFINSARGQQVRQDELAEVFAQRDDLNAILDVTTPMKLPAESPLWALPNVLLTSHIAGSHGRETDRMVHYLLAAYRQYLSDGSLPGEVHLADWEHSA
jgi:phosphoglycerate dehydrogenase-like enzyme